MIAMIRNVTTHLSILYVVLVCKVKGMFRTATPKGGYSSYSVELFPQFGAWIGILGEEMTVGIHGIATTTRGLVLVERPLVITKYM